ncbi:DUF1800 domain-containing protein [Hymenobacter psychrotolerans]|uniref:Uncharacterized conserved protein, DUF1800 family n=1 Tax=Hymenobacter psychrotolerans DSM 18569 TaxID=1121959 RepID=A0A1M7GXB7_9BACT|nr:DUF1800 domain-containing protein [Hymenobacter psychrotolerans]SHM20850.1 Uncharacterized conserved protein, DUF1800 family [Hymenobacter psychrotolerans DSM 18569]
MTTTQQQLQHLYWRAGFGPRPEDLAAGLSPRKALRQLLRDSEKVELLDSPQMRYIEPLTQFRPVAPAAGTPQSGMVTTPDQTAMAAGAESTQLPLRSALPAPPKGRNQPPLLRRQDLSPQQRKMQNQSIREAFYAMNTGWLQRMATSPAQLREKLTFFWHGHFACRVRRPDAALQLNNTIRQLALGKFSDLLLAVSKEPAMLQFLNNQQNRKQRPNENFAREVLELFTMGRGHYTETDVKEAARAFTGWGYTAQGHFVFREKQHDDGPKTFLGRTGNFTGEQVLSIVLEQPRTAEFITTKLYRFFVNDTPDPAHIQPLAQAFFKSGYNISALLEQMFSADWFYAPANVGTRIKAPVELLAGIKRTMGLQLADDKPLIVFQKALGQTLFEPPNVAGWPGGRNWIDSSSLLYRLQLPSVLLKNAAFNVALKQDENDIAPNLTRADRTFQQQVKATVKLGPVQALLAKTPPARQLAQLSELLLQTPIRPENLALIQQAADKVPAEERLRTMVTSLLSLPEYQLM